LCISCPPGREAQCYLLIPRSFSSVLRHIPFNGKLGLVHPAHRHHCCCALAPSDGPATGFSTPNSASTQTCQVGTTAFRTHLPPECALPIYRQPSRARKTRYGACQCTIYLVLEMITGMGPRLATHRLSCTLYPSHLRFRLAICSSLYSYRMRTTVPRYPPGHRARSYARTSPVGCKKK